MMHIRAVLVDDNEGQFRSLERILDPSKYQAIDFDGENIAVELHKIVVSLRDGEPDLDATLDAIGRIDPGVAVVDMRLAGDDVEDLTGLDLSLKIKSRHPDCCIILVSSYFPATPSFKPFEHLEVLRHLVDRSKPSEIFQSDVIERFRAAVLTHFGSLNYRRKRFAATVNGARECAWGMVLDRAKSGITIDDSLPLPVLRSDSVAVETIEVGVCGTDRRALGLSTSPDYKIIDFHEAFGRVVWTGEDVRSLHIGDLVVPMVRRCQTWDRPMIEMDIVSQSFKMLPCDHLTACESAHQPDHCPKGRYSGPLGDGQRVGYTSRGTGRCHGFGAQYFVDVEDWLVRIDTPQELGLRERMMNRYVLAEPLSIVWKMRREILRHVQVREFRDEVLIIGLGPIGLLAAVVFGELHPGLRITGVDLAEEDNRRVTLLRQYYPGFEFVHSESEQACPASLVGRKFQLIVEATDQPENIFRYAPRLLSPGGILVLLGLSDENHQVEIDAGAVSELVRSGNTLIGSINSSRSDFEDSIAFMETVIGNNDSLLDDIIERWQIDDELPQKLVNRLGETRPKHRSEIKVVLKAKELTDKLHR